MSKLRRKFITVLAVLFCALLCLSTALLIPKHKNAGASSLSNVLELGDNGNFSAKALRTLYGYIYSGSTTYGQLSDKLGAAKGTVLRKYSQMSTKTTVKLGGYEWNVVAASKNQNGEVIATLWLSTGPYTSLFADAAFQDITTASDFAPGEYGMSLVRSTLVKDARYATSLTQDTNSDNSRYNEFWATFVTNYGDYIDTPYAVCGDDGYQATQKATALQAHTSSLGNFYLPNDSYKKLDNSVAVGHWMDAESAKVQECTYYGQWQDDKLWLPSITETGFSATCTGLWDINNNTVRANGLVSTDPSLNCTWTRSGCCSGASVMDVITADGSSFWNNTSWKMINVVRPAIHLNLSKAANGVSYEAVTVTNEQNGTDVLNTETEHTFSRKYDGNEVKVTLADHDNLEIENGKPYAGDNDYSQTEASYDSTDGVFKATKPKKDADETYVIKVTPINDHMWDDDDSTDPRYYKIKITLATINTAQWGNPEVSNGESLLQETNKITSSTSRTGITYKEKYYIVKPEESPSTPQPSDWVTNGGWNVDWEDRDETSETNSYFKASKKGEYVVYYEITADFHETKRGSYKVTVTGTDTMELTIKGDIPNETFGDTKAADLKSSLITNLGNYVTFTQKSNNKTYSGQDLVDLLGLLELVVLDDSGTEVELAAGRNYYNAGTYSLHVKYNSTVTDANKTFAFKWKDDEKPTLTIDKREFVVGIVAAEGKSLSHVYGSFDSTALEYEIDKDALPDGEKEDYLLIEKGTFKIVKEDGTLGDTLNNRTPANSAGTNYKIKGVASENGNYDIIFNEVSYTVTKRALTVKVADEEAEYGTDYSSYNFGDMTKVDGSPASFDTLSNLTKNAKYYLLMNDSEVELSSTLGIGEYVLCAKITSDNYTITVESGKLHITEANFNMDGVKLENKGYIYDSKPHEAKISGELPSEEITVSYRYVNYDTGEELEGAPTEVGLYLVYATFSHNNPNYNPIAGKAAYIRIAYSEAELNEPYPPLPTDAELAAAADLAKKKTEAKKTLDEEAQKKKDEIDADVNLSAEEKKAAKDEIDKELKDGNAAIDKAKDKDGVDKAYDDGKKEIEDTTELAKKKGAAKSELDKAAQAKKDAIDADPELTDEEKAAAKAEVDKELEEGKKAIDGATDINSVQSAESSTKTNIENIKAEHKGSFPWWILAIIAGAILLVTVLIIVIVKRRNADDDDGGYDDFYDDEYDYEEEEVEDDGDEAFGY